MSPAQTAALALTPALAAGCCLGGLMLAGRFVKRLQAQRKFKRRTRAKVIEIGYTAFNTFGSPYPASFVFEIAHGSEVVSYGPDGQLLIGNYTTEELNELIARRKEFE